MGIFSNLFRKTPSLGVQPHRDWPWTLSVNGVPGSDFGWEDIARALDRLGPNSETFVILEQNRGGDYWYIQSAVALAGPHAGEYTTGVGWSAPDGRHYIERCGGYEEAVSQFRAVWEGKPLDFAGYEDQSDLLPGNS